MDKLNKITRGIGLLELMLSLSIIAILLILATQYFTVVSAKRRVMDGLNMIQGIRAASERAQLVNLDFSDGGAQKQVTDILPVLIARNYLSTKFTTNPWGGTTSVVPNPDGAGKIQQGIDLEKIMINFPNIGNSTECRLLLQDLCSTIDKTGLVCIDPVNTYSCAISGTTYTFSGKFAVITGT